MSAPRDNPGVIAPPPLLWLAALLAALALHWAWPASFLADAPAPARIAAGAVFAAIALALFTSAIATFSRAGTPVQTRRTPARLVTHGIFARLRNPIYVAFMLLLCASAFWAASLWPFATAALFALVIHWGVVRREEIYLERKFGDDYRAYKARTPRYGWRF